MKRTLLTAQWEIISTCEWIEINFPNGGQLPTAVLPKIYKGKAVPFIMAGKAKSKQKWGVTIVTLAKADNGEEHTHEMAFRVPHELTFAEFMNGSDQVYMNDGGFTVRWKGVAKMWLDEVDSVLKGMTAITAHATARCLAEVK